MRYRVSSILLLTLAVAVVMYATRYGGQVTGLAFFLFGASGGAISANRGIWQRCGRGAVGSAVAL